MWKLPKKPTLLQKGDPRGKGVKYSVYYETIVFLTSDRQGRKGDDQRLSMFRGLNHFIRAFVWNGEKKPRRDAIE